MRQKHCWKYFAFNQSYLAKGKIALGQSSHFDYYIWIQDKMAINFDASDLTLSYRKVVQIELLSEVINVKNFCFRIKSKAKTWVTSIIFLSVVGQSSHFDGNIQIQDKMAINFDASDLTLSYQKVIQIELVSEIINEKNFCFRIKSKAETWVTSINFAECGGSKFPFLW